jgi:hypothetical protein
MEQILKNLSDPSWWFTGIFFVLLGLLLTKLFFNWLPIAFRYIGTLIPSFYRTYSRWREKRVFLQIKKYRQYEIKVNWLIARYWSIATITMVYTGFSMISFMLYPNIYEEPKRKLVLLMIIIPSYLLQLITVSEKRVLKRVMNAHLEWNKRIAKRSA